MASTAEARPGSTEDPEEVLRVLHVALTAAGVGQETAASMAEAALVLGAVESGTPITDLPLTSCRARQAEPTGDVGSVDGNTPQHESGSVDAHLDDARYALCAVEALTQVSTRLDGALVVAARAQTAAIGASLLTEKGVTSPEDLTESGRRRWRSQAKSLTRHEIEAATGWAPGEVVDRKSVV